MAPLAQACRSATRGLPFPHDDVRPGQLSSPLRSLRAQPGKVRLEVHLAVSVAGGTAMQDQPKRPVGRPVERGLPEPITDTPENIVRIILATSPRAEDE